MLKGGGSLRCAHEAFPFRVFSSFRHTQFIISFPFPLFLLLLLVLVVLVLVLVLFTGVFCM
jgi:hypothetical protein